MSALIPKLQKNVTVVAADVAHAANATTAAIIITAVTLTIIIIMSIAVTIVTIIIIITASTIITTTTAIKIANITASITDAIAHADADMVAQQAQEEQDTERSKPLVKIVKSIA